MALTPDEVAHIARLARLGLTDEEKTQYAVSLSSVLEHVSRIQAIDTSAVAETAQVGEVVNAWRDDEPAPSMGGAEVLAQAPDRDGDFFRVGAIQE